VLGALVGLIAPLALAAANAWTLDSLLQRLELPQGEPLAYHQERRSGLLAEPVITRGEITYRQPGYLRKTMVGAGGERLLVIEDGRVRLQGPDGSRTRGLEDMPALRALMGVLDAVARGDAAALRSDYRARLTGGPEAWGLTLTVATDRHGGGAGRAEGTRIDLTGGRHIERIRLDSEAFGRVKITFEERAR
jgi:hypothetical protein